MCVILQKYFGEILKVPFKIPYKYSTHTLKDVHIIQGDFETVPVRTAMFPHIKAPYIMVDLMYKHTGFLQTYRRHISAWVIGSSSLTVFSLLFKSMGNVTQFEGRITTKDLLW